MAATHAIPFTRHPFADGAFKQMLIDGQWVEAASGKTFESLNPATGELLATVAEGDAEDIDRAVAAARARLRGPVEQGQAVRAPGAAAQARRPGREELRRARACSTRSTWARRSAAPAAPSAACSACCATTPARRPRIHGETIENSLPGDIFSYTLKEPVGVVGAIIPWNGPLGASDLEDRPGARDRLHGRAQAGRGGAADPAAAGRAVPGGRRAAGRRQHRARLRRDRRRRAGRASRTSTRSRSPART